MKDLPPGNLNKRIREKKSIHTFPIKVSHTDQLTIFRSFSTSIFSTMQEAGVSMIACYPFHTFQQITVKFLILILACQGTGHKHITPLGVLEEDLLCKKLFLQSWVIVRKALTITYRVITINQIQAASQARQVGRVPSQIHFIISVVQSHKWMERECCS